MRLWELDKNYYLRNHNGATWINDRKISDKDAELISNQLNNIAVKYPRSYYAKMSNDLLRTFYNRNIPGK
jgi:hypothetical protein